MIQPLLLQKAVDCLQKGQVIAYPTEAIYGLGCDPDDEDALREILRLKRRPWQKGLILLAADFAQLTPYVQPLSDELQKTIFATWPGPVTWLLPAAAGVSRYLRGDSSDLAVRVTAHPLSAALARQFGKPIVSTSANPSQAQPAKNARRVRAYFGNELGYILNGALGGRDRPSEIRHALTGQCRRS
ncbi:L-threonylcarbamoyladenylate synthase [Thioflexithrix psekupsensis]|uniref:Threonylcarbamoyl-AMP synthase n=1 Tax=Thioflexithrix psekupsensis TaxID=1570016 RepID=A0A251X6M8_9GAMM|nr:L-threonylcarbamoyladenylate synthase [Thioflexithrix psekupsensis]OUD13272.1 threonylcarbamoyl-AMP synthase [Thioflexithrix psekupsensis]